MNDLRLTQAPVTETGMLIRKPPADVFEAFVDPAVTTQFWFTKSSGRLETGKQVQWEWEMYGVSIAVTAKVVETDKRIVIEWPGYSGPTIVEWTFTPHQGGATFVSITERGFTGTGDELVKQVTELDAGLLAGARRTQGVPRARHPTRI